MGGVSQVPIPTAPVVRVLLECKGMGQRVQLGSGRGVVHSGTKANSNLQTVVKQGVRWGIGGKTAQARKRDPGCLGDTAENACEILRSDADDREWMAVDRNRTAYDGRIRVEAIAPQGIGENDLVICAVSSVVGIRHKETAALRPEPEKLKVVRGDKAGGEGPGLPTRLGEIDLCLGEGDSILPGMPRFAHEAVVVIGHRVAVISEHGRIDKAKIARRLNVWPGTIKNSIGPGRYGGERTDAKGQSEHRGDEKPGRTTHLANGELQIPQEVLQPQPAPALPRHICNQWHISELARRRPARFGGRLAASDPVGDRHL